MKIFSCSKCGSNDVFIEKSGNNTGLYCGDCGKWIKWLTKDEVRLAERQMNMMKDDVIQQLINKIKNNKFIMEE